jgi:crossover junction endodeoxyribonuclease RusA
MPYQIELPFPPTANTYWRKWKNRMVLSPRGEQYKLDVQAAVGLNPPRLSGRLCLMVSAWMPDRKRRDIDNLLKPLLDALTYAGVWDDDSQVKALSIAEAGVRKPGSVQIQITRMD